MTRVAIVGAGVSGLSLAFSLERRSTPSAPVEVTVLEAAPRAGGNLRSEHVHGYICEWGPNGFLDNAPATLALVRDLRLEPRLLRSSDTARRRFLFYRGRLYRIPENPVSFFSSSLLSWRGRLRAAAEPFAHARPEADETIHEFASRRLGPEAADVLIDAMVSGVFGGDARELSLRACFPRMHDMESRHGSLLRALLARRGARAGAGPVGSPLGRLTSFRDGVEELVHALVASLSTPVRRHARVEAVEPAPPAPGAPRWHVRVAGLPPIDADHVVFAAGAAATSRIVAGVAPSLAATLAEIPSAPMVVVCLGYDAAGFPHPLDGFGFLVPRREGIRMLGALWESSIYPARAPRGRVLIRVMLGGATDSRTVELTDAELLRDARAGLQATMGVRSDPVFSRVIRHPVGIPQYTRGHLGRLARVDQALAAHQGLWVAGNSYRGVAINACVADALQLADRIIPPR